MLIVPTVRSRRIHQLDSDFRFIQYMFVFFFSLSIKVFFFYIPSSLLFFVVKEGDSFIRIHATLSIRLKTIVRWLNRIVNKLPSTLKGEKEREKEDH